MTESICSRIGHSSSCLLTDMNMQCEEASPCFAGAECTDLPKGYECGACPSGYNGSTLRGFDIIDARTIMQV